jgi:hypothetical protein
MKKNYIYGKDMSHLDFLLNVFNHSVHLGLCIASVFYVSNLLKL